MKTVAIIGASNNREKFGNKAVRAFLRQGYTVFPVNLRETKVEGLPAFRSIRDVPVRPEMISVYLPPPLVQAGLTRDRGERMQRTLAESWLRIRGGSEASQTTGFKRDSSLQHRGSRGGA